MDRFSSDLTLTSTETADLLKVHPSTVKRWCNGGELPFETTDGGHRRIRLDDAVAFARAQDIRTVLTPFHPYEPHVWTALREAEDAGVFDRVLALAMGWVHGADLRRVEDLLLAIGRSNRVAFGTFCDHVVRGLMRQVGDAWQNGRLRVGEEHMVSQVTSEVLLRLRAEWLERRAGVPREDPERLALVGTVEGNQHHIGALCVRMQLERLGWRVLYLGPDVPIEDFGIIQKSREAQLVCISLPPTGTIGDVSRSLSILREFYDPSLPYVLAFGGASVDGLPDSALDGPFERVDLFGSCGALVDAVDPRAAAGRRVSP